MEEPDDPPSSKLKRTSPETFQVNEAVEVRRAQKGLRGSWHPGTVIECGRVKCHVKYDNVGQNEGLDSSVDVVRLSSASESSNCNMHIRPVPPLVEFQRLELKYGLCVDVNFQEAWWEGVIFDHSDEMDKRIVFFPDLGAEMKFDIRQLRITQDWNELTHEWKQRENWVFLDLLDECHNSTFAASARQIWFDVQEKLNYGTKGEWIYNVKDLYRNVVSDIVNDYKTLSVRQAFSDLKLPESLQDERPDQEPVEPIMALPVKKVLVQEEPVPPDEFERQINLDGAAEGVSGARCSERSRSTQNQERRNSRASKTIRSKSQSNRLSSQEAGSNKWVTKVSSPPLIPQNKPLTILSWLIDNKMVLPRSNIYYYNEQEGYYAASTMAMGRISRNGIKCSCCHLIHGIVGFESHVSGGNTCIPAANVFLKDGKSLLECQIEIMQKHMRKEAGENSGSNFFLADNDFVCSICLFGGELILCDQCPSSFHQRCLGLEDIPDGEWHCPQCRCRICGQSKVEGDDDGHALTCVQCQLKYHVKCLENEGVDTSGCPENWFCGRSCERIHDSLHQLLGRPVSVGVDNLTWTLVKFIKPDTDDRGRVRGGSLMAENYSKLNLALSVMHECFEPSISTLNFYEDVIFSRRSKLNRLNFQGFYTVLLEKNEEVVCVALVRIHGAKVAEVPLVGTRLHFRRHGFCHILMSGLEQNNNLVLQNEAMVEDDQIVKHAFTSQLPLENLLMQLGVERVVLPSISSTLKTWTGSFGFSKMADFEKSQFMDYIFLDFENSIMCQKLLGNIPPPNAESQPRPESGGNLDKSSPVSNERMQDQQMGNTCPGNNNDHAVGVSDPVNMVEKVVPSDQKCHNASSSRCFDEEEDGEENNPQKKVRKVVHKGRHV
ncbi:unnamed protein product [Sphenostylis stenocarpa]|uniref:PHD-type domain-containing protein n=1 Tax=Sphenostylis stenocarpa TaxID=92480 RepID=A0AA86SX37_9FABA|nr:unnamed protein product [Sphenostylis stenocarpa]